tara:strand:- start:101 stop:340 length:240 start_codon:yes stop_codon:yes gene_type:complete
MTKEIKELGIVELFENVLKIPMDKLIAMDWEEESKLVRDWAEKHNYLVYSEPREKFFKWEAIRLARRYNYDGVILENLS